jgi:hypothetical protein
MSHGVISSATSSVSDSCQASVFPFFAARAGLGEIARAEASPLGAEDDDARGGIAVGLVEALDERALEVAADRVQLVAAVEGDDADAAVDGIGHEGRGHGGLLGQRGMTGSMMCDG